MGGHAPDGVIPPYVTPWLDGLAFADNPRVPPDRSYSITELVTAFRLALVALTPSAEAVGVTWKDGETYDEWDVVEDVLFDVYVASVVRGDVARFGSSQPFAQYGSSGVRYGNRSWFEVLVPPCQGPLVLVRLNSPRGFSEIQVVRLNTRDEVCAELVVPWTPQLRFVTRLRSPDGRLTRVEVVTPTESAVQRTRPSTGR